MTFQNKKREGAKSIIFTTECFPLRKKKTCDTDSTHIRKKKERKKKKYKGTLQKKKEGGFLKGIYIYFCSFQQR